MTRIFRFLHVPFSLCCILLWAVAGIAVAQKKTFTLVIDAGHGGKDAGAVGKLTQEKTINLNVALALGALIEQNLKDVKVVYTRKTDVFIPLDQRARIANNAKADLFLSIHTNSAASSTTAQGAETYTLGMHRAKDNLEVAKRENSVILHEKDYKTNYAGFDPSKAESYIIFELMQDQYMKQSVNFARKIQGQYISHAQRKNKGVHQAGFLVLRATSMPSVLTELGFISTPDEEAFLHSTDGVNKMANSLYKAFVAYKNEQQGTTASATIPTTPATSTSSTTPTKKKEQALVSSTPLTTDTDTALPDSLRWLPTPIDSTRGTLIAVAPLTPEHVVLPLTTLTPVQSTATTPIITEATTAEIPDQPITIEEPVIAEPTPIVSPKAEPTPSETEPQPTLQPTKPERTKVEAPTKPEHNKVETPAKSTQTNTTPKTTTPKSTAPKATTPTTAPRIEYRVQIVATSTPIATGDKRFEGLTQIDHYTEGGLYKYTVGHATTEAEAAKLRASLTARFPQCFIIALRDGKRITIAEARATTRK